MLDVASGTSLTVTNALTIASDPSQSIAPLQLYGGGSAQVGSLILSGSLEPIALDSESKLEVGTTGGADAGDLTVDAGRIVSGSGDLSRLDVTNNGLVTASNGTLALGTVKGAGALSISGGSTLSLAASENNPINFAGANATLLLRATSAKFGQVTGFAPGETIAVSTLPQSLPTNVAYTPTGVNVGTLSLTNQFGTNVTLTLSGDYTGAQFVLGAGGSPGIAAVTIACFAAGTRIAIPQGEAAVEELRIGDLVCTRFSPRAQPIIWIGHRRIDCRRHPAPRQVWPVRVRAGCFDDGLPSRDLLLSPDHAVFAEGVLIPVKYLINGTTIAQVEVDEVTYYHLELPRHDVVLAEGLPAESYLDTGDRANFVNGGSVVRAYPDFVSRSWEAAGCAPLVVSGPEVSAVQSHLRTRRPTIRGRQRRRHSPA